MNKSFHRVVVAAVVGFCASCTTVAPPPPTASIATQEDAYILIGTSEEDYEYQFAIVRGNIDQDKFSVPHHFGDPPAYGPGEDGFIILKADPQTTLGVGSVEILIKGTHLTALSFAPCKSTLVFTPQAGKVVYVGTVDLSDKRVEGYLLPGLATSVRFDATAAKAFLDKHYPALSDKLVQGIARQLPISGGECRPDYYTPFGDR